MEPKLIPPSSTRKRINHTEKALKDHADAIRNIRTDIDEKEKIIEELSKQCLIKEKTIDKRNRTYIKKKELLDLNICDFNANIPIENEKLDQEILQQEEKLKQLTNDYDEIVVKLQNLQLKYNKLQDNDKKLNGELDSLDESIKKLAVPNDLQASSLEDDVNDLAEEIKELSTDIANCKISHLNYDAMSSILKTKYTKTMKTLEELRNQILKIKTVNEKDINSLNNTISESKNNNVPNIYELKQKKEKLTKIIQQILVNCDEAKEDIEQTTNKVNRLNANLEKKQSDLKILQKQQEDIKQMSNTRILKSKEFLDTQTNLINTVHQQKMELLKLLAHDKAILDSKNNDENELQMKIAEKISKISDEEENARNNEILKMQIVKQESVNEKEAFEAKLEFDGLTVLIEELVKEKTKQLHKLDKINSTVIEPLGDQQFAVPIPKTPLVREVKLISKINDEITAKIVSTQRRIEQYKELKEKIEKRIEKLKSQTNQNLQAHIILQNSIPKKRSQFSIYNSVETSRLHRLIAEKTISIEERRATLAKRQRIVGSITNELDITTYPERVVVAPEPQD